LIKEFFILIIFYIFFHRNFESIRVRKPDSQSQSNLSKSNALYIVQYVFYLVVFGTLYYRSPELIGTDSGANVLATQISALVICFFSVYIIGTTVYVLSINLKFRERLVTMSFTFCIILGSFLLITISENRMSYRLIISGYPKYFVSLSLSNGLRIASDKTILFIGSTKNYLFFRKTDTNTNLIIPRAIIISEEQRELRKGL